LETAAQDKLGLKDSVHPPIRQGLEMPDEFEPAQFPLLLRPPWRPPLWTKRIIEQNEEHTPVQIA
jgi:hypothetical protein